MGNGGFGVNRALLVLGLKPYHCGWFNSVVDLEEFKARSDAVFVEIDGVAERFRPQANLAIEMESHGAE